MAKKCEDETTKADLVSGVDAAERVLTKANEAVNRDLLDEAMEELKYRVDDWKNHRIEQFGNLLQHGVHSVATGKSDHEKDVSDLHPGLSPEPRLTLVLVRDLPVRVHPPLL